MKKAISDEENELRTLMTRVMDAPLIPFQKKVDSMEARMSKLEEVTSKNVSATNNLNEAVEKINKELKNGFADLLDELPAVLSGQMDPLMQSLSEIGQQQGGILGAVNENWSRAGELATTMRDSIAACDGTLQIATGQLQQMNTSVQTSIEHVLDTLGAVKSSQISVEPILSNLQVKSIEAANTLQAQQLVIEAFKYSLPTLLQDVRQEFDSSLSTGLEATQASILATVERYMTEQQQGLFTRLKLLKTLTVVNLLALACVIGLASTLVIGHG